MANWTDQSKIDRLWKALFNRARTSPDKAFFEENIPTTFDLHANEIYIEEIPQVPPETDTAVIKKVNLTLTKDGTVSGNRAWVALSTWQANWSSGSGDVTQIVKNFISPKYGSSYGVKVFKGDDTRIPELSNLSWAFDYKPGVLLFESDPGQNGSTKATSIKIEAYQYIGKMASDTVGSTSGTNPEPITGDTALVRASNKVTQINSPGKVTYLLYFQSNPTGSIEDLTGKLQAAVEVIGDTVIATGMNYKNDLNKTIFYGTHIETLANSPTLLDDVRANFGGVVV